MLGKFVRIEYTGCLDSGEVFDSTDPKIIKEASGPVTIILGAGHVIKGMERALLEMKMGETRELEITPDEGFGRRDPKQIKLYKLQDFLKEGVRPYPEMRVTLEGRVATIKSISSGRVVVDFNHPLSGRALKYKIRLVEEVLDPNERIKEILKFHFGKDVEFAVEGDVLELKGVPDYFKERLKDEFATYTDFKNIRFVNVEGGTNEKHDQVG